MSHRHSIGLRIVYFRGRYYGEENERAREGRLKIFARPDFIILNFHPVELNREIRENKLL